MHPTHRFDPSLWLHLWFWLLLLAGSLSACRVDRYAVEREAPRPVIDGQRNDWKQVSLQSHARAPLRYALRQDTEGLYLLLLIDDPAWQQQILMTGLTTYLAAEGRGAAQRGLRYPLGLDRSNQPRDPNRLNEFLGRLQASQTALLGTMQGMEMIGFQADKDTVYTDNPNPAGLHAAAQFVDQTLVWEMRIPPRLLPGLTQAEEVSLVWETGELARPEQLRGSDAAGLGGSDPSHSTQNRGQSERDWLDRLDRYREFASPRKAKVLVILP